MKYWCLVILYLILEKICSFLPSFQAKKKFNYDYSKGEYPQF